MFNSKDYEIHTVDERNLNWLKAARWGRELVRRDGFIIYEWDGKLWITEDPDAT